MHSKFNCLVQASYMSCNRRSRARIVARNLTYALGLQDGRSTWGTDRSEGVRWVVWTVTSSLPHSNDSAGSPRSGGSRDVMEGEHSLRGLYNQL